MHAVVEANEREPAKQQEIKTAVDQLLGGEGSTNPLYKNSFPGSSLDVQSRTKFTVLF